MTRPRRAHEPVTDLTDAPARARHLAELQAAIARALVGEVDDELVEWAWTAGYAQGLSDALVGSTRTAEGRGKER